MSQEYFHLYLRFKKKGGIRNLSSDASYLKKNLLCCIKRLSKKYDKTTTPPRISKRCDPLYLYKNNSEFNWIKSNKIKFNKLKNIVRFIWKLDKTKPHSEYMKTIENVLYNDKQWTKEKMRDMLSVFFKIPHNDWVPHMLGV